MLESRARGVCASPPPPDHEEVDMRKKQPAPRKPRILRRGDLIVDVDWSSTGMWVCDPEGRVCNCAYKDFAFPKALVERFKFWTEWHDRHAPWNGETGDYDLFRSYGRALAVDVKRSVGNQRRVFYGFYADNQRKCQVSEEEIELPKIRGEQVAKKLV
jgi:hypothetical protein